MSLYTTYGSNPDFENDGVWYKATTTEDGREVKFLLARMGGANKRYEIAAENAAKPFRRSIRKDTIRSEKAREINMSAFVNGCLLDWQNVDDENGEPIEFNKVNASALLKKLPDLYEDLVDIATSREVYAEEGVEEDSGN